MKNEIKNSRSILIFGIVLTLAAPWFFVQDWFSITFIDTGQIGDTIGGITSPIVGLIGAILVFKALQAQIVANKIITDQFEEQKKDQLLQNDYLSIQKEIEFLIDDIKNLTFIVKESRKFTETIKGPAAIIETLNNICTLSGAICKNNSSWIKEEEPNIIVIFNFLKKIKLLFNRIESSNLIIKDKEDLYKQTIYVYDSMLSPFILKFSLRTSKFNKNVCQQCGNKHFGIPQKLIDYINELDFKTVVPVKEKLGEEFHRVDFVEKVKTDEKIQINY